MLTFKTHEPQKTVVRIGDSFYILREASSEVGCLYQNALIANAEFDAETGKASLANSKMADVQPTVVAGSIVRATLNPEGVKQLAANKDVEVTLAMLTAGEAIGEAEVRSWNYSIVADLFNWVKSVSKLGGGENPTPGQSPKQTDTKVS